MRNLLPNPKGELFFALVDVDVDYFEVLVWKSFRLLNLFRQR
jgi:hypothetical protein